MAEFITGDFIRLKNVNEYHIDRVEGDKVNIFEIKNTTLTHVEIHGCKVSIPRSEIEPIPINRKDDLKIKYNPIIAATVYDPRESGPPERDKDYSYYLEAYNNCLKKEIEKETNSNFKYVHEVQHFLRTNSSGAELKIDTY